MKEVWQFSVQAGKVSIQRMSVMSPDQVMYSFGPYPAEMAVANLAIIALGFEPQNLVRSEAATDMPMDYEVAAALADKIALSLGYQLRRTLVRHELPFDQTLPAQRYRSEILNPENQA